MVQHLSRFIGGIVDRLVKREPVLFFGAIGLWIGVAWDIDPDSRAGLALAGTILLFQRAYTESKAVAEENVEQAKYVGAVENQAVTNAGIVLAQSEPTRPLRAPR